MYSICHLVFGFDCSKNDFNETSPMRKLIDEHYKKSKYYKSDPDNYLEDTLGFWSCYSGSAESLPLALGVEIGGFDECSNCTLASLLEKQAVVSEEKLDEYDKLLDSLPKDLKEKILSSGLIPEVILMWGTS